MNYGNQKFSLCVVMSPFAILTVILSCYFFTISIASAQQTGNLTKMIDDKYAKLYKSPFCCGNDISYQLVTVRYESPTTILISGNLLEPVVNTFNSGIWEAMDMLKGQYGFKLQQIMTSGVGSKENPTDVYILMTK